MDLVSGILLLTVARDRLEMCSAILPGPSSRRSLIRGLRFKHLHAR